MGKPTKRQARAEAKAAKKARSSPPPSPGPSPALASAVREASAGASAGAPSAFPEARRSSAAGSPPSPMPSPSVGRGGVPLEEIGNHSPAASGHSCKGPCLHSPKPNQFLPKGVSPLDPTEGKSEESPVAATSPAAYDPAEGGSEEKPAAPADAEGEDEVKPAAQEDPDAPAYDATTYTFDPEDKEAWDEFYAWLIEEAEKVPTEKDAEGKHVRPAAILVEDGVKEFLFMLLWADYIANVDSMGITQAQQRESMTLDMIKVMFGSIDVDIDRFRNDLEEFHNKSAPSFFRHAMLVYSLRFKQCACAKCGRQFEDFMFGLLSAESNHYADDTAQTEEERTKLFNLSRECFSKSIVDILIEFVKTRIECSDCHNKFGTSKPYDALPDRCFGEYRHIQPRAFCDVQDSDECEALYRCIEELRGRDLRKLTYAEIESALNDIQQQTSLDTRDLLTFNEDEYNGFSKSARDARLGSIYYKGEKRLAGGCLWCEMLFCTRPTRDQQGQHGHHVNERKKHFNPSESENYSLTKARAELRKTVPLCACCHMKVTYDDALNEEFLAKLKELGYAVNRSTGEIYRPKRRTRRRTRGN